MKIELNGKPIVIEFGIVKRMPEPDRNGYFHPKAVAYVKGQDGSRDVYMALFHGYQVKPGNQHPAFKTRRLELELKPNDEVFFVREQGTARNQAAIWGITYFYDLAVKKMADRLTIFAHAKTANGGPARVAPSVEPAPEIAEPNGNVSDDLGKLLDGVCGNKGKDITGKNRAKWQCAYA